MYTGRTFTYTKNTQHKYQYGALYYVYVNESCESVQTRCGTRGHDRWQALPIHGPRTSGRKRQPLCKSSLCVLLASSSLRLPYDTTHEQMHDDNGRVAIVITARRNSPQATKFSGFFIRTLIVPSLSHSLSLRRNACSSSIDCAGA